MPFLSDFSSPAVTREAFVHGSGYSEKGTPLLTLDALESFSKGRGSRTERRYRCPFCGGTEAAFHVNVETGAFNCKRSSCGVKGCLREFWSEKPQPTFQGRGNARKRASSAFALSPEVTFQPTTGGNWREQWDASFDLDAPESKLGCDYLSGRGIALDVAKCAGVRFSRNWAPSAESKRYTGGAAILFPLTNRTGELVAVGSRYLKPWTSPEGDTIKARTGGDLIEGVFRVPGSEGVDPLQCEYPVLVEGPVDALALATCGVAALGMNGVNCPAWLPHALAFKSPFLAPDGDEGGAKALTSWKRDIGPFAPRLRVLQIASELNVKDFGDALQKDGAEVLIAWLIGAGVLPDVEEQPLPKSWRDRDVSYWERVHTSTSPGAQKVCHVLHDYTWLFDQYRQGSLPEGGCRMIVDDHIHNFDNAAEIVGKLLSDWTERATRCSDEKRDLTPEEESDLQEAREALEWLCAAYSPADWLDLKAVVDDVQETANRRSQQYVQTRVKEVEA